MRRSTIILLTLLFLMWIPLSQAAEGDVLIDFYSESNYNENWSGVWDFYSKNFSASGQTFSTPGIRYKITKVAFYLTQLNPSSQPSAWIKAYLFEINGTFGVDAIPNSLTPLAMSNSKWMDDMPETPEIELINFDFAEDQQYVMEANHNYGISCVAHNGTVMQTLGVGEQWIEDGQGSDDGNSFRMGSYLAGEGWKPLGLDEDIIFYVYGIPASAQASISSNLQLAAALMIGLFILVFIVHMIYMIDSGNSQNFVELLTGYVLSAIIICGLAIIMLSIGG